MAARPSADLARHALECVCSRPDPCAAAGIYSEDFLDHVIGMWQTRRDKVEDGLANLRMQLQPQMEAEHAKAA
jgi:hypothetical protein